MNTTTETTLPSDHPLMKAWNEFCSTEEFQNALYWATATDYLDGRIINLVQRKEHAKGSLWCAFVRGATLDLTSDLTSDNNSNITSNITSKEPH